MKLDEQTNPDQQNDDRDNEVDVGDDRFGGADKTHRFGLLRSRFDATSAYHLTSLRSVTDLPRQL
jgi:hypothetical protein